MSDNMSASGAMPSKSERTEERILYQITFDDNNKLSVGTKRGRSSFSEGDVQDLNGEFIVVLENIRRQVVASGDIHLSKSVCQDYLEELRRVGRAAYVRAFSKEMRQYLANLAKKAEEQQQGLSWNLLAQPESSFLWETLYAGKPRALAALDPMEFWGFRYPIGRIYWDIDDFPRVEMQGGVFSAVHSQLTHSMQEVENLRGRLQGMGLGLNCDSFDQLVDAQTVSGEAFLQHLSSKHFYYGLVHFACHCSNPIDAGASQAALLFTACGQEIHLPLLDLVGFDEEDMGFLNEPFVFLNACESGTPMHLAQMLSFPDGILRLGAAGVVATACTIPDQFASAFATKFYHYLLPKVDEGSHRNPNILVNIGEALVETRLHFLEKFNNPLGLAYGLHAVSNQKLRLMPWLGMG